MDVVGSMSLVADVPEEVAVTLTNEIGLHARPAALVARTLSEVDAQVTVRLGAARPTVAACSR